MDFARAESCDLFSYICKEKNVDFKQVLLKTKQVLGIKDLREFTYSRPLFGGIYEHVGVDYKPILKTYSDDVLL